MTTPMMQDGPAPLMKPVSHGWGLTKWLLLLALIGILVAAVAGGITYSMWRATQEVRDMRPWPGKDVSAAELATLDLSHLGLEVSTRRDAREVYGSEAAYSDGAVIEYEAAGDLAVTVGALRYDTPDDAGADFSHIQAWAEENCGWYAGIAIGWTGVIRCGYDDAHNRILWSGNWILDITATDADEFPPSDMVDQVRDAAAAHWKAIEVPGPRNGQAGQARRAVSCSTERETPYSLSSHTRPLET